LILVLGFLGLILSFVVCTALLLDPEGLARRMEYLPRRAQSLWRELQPQPLYLPTPAPPSETGRQGDGETRRQVSLSPPLVSGTSLPSSPVPSPTPTPLPSPTATATRTDEPMTRPHTPTPTPTATVPLKPMATAVRLTGFAHEWQRWNNCGPATIAMHLSHYGWAGNQLDAAAFLKPDPEDKNVSPEELAAYAQSVGFRALARVNSNLERVKQLLSNGFPITAEMWLIRSQRDQLGHYRVVIGYDDASSQVVTYDSLHGPDVTLSYEEFEAMWRVFNRVYVVIYPPEQAPVLAAILGQDLDDTAMIQGALTQAQAEAEEDPIDPFAWFNVGTNLTALGRYEEASAAYDQARKLGLPWRMLWYQFGPYEAYQAVGRYQDVLTLTQATLASAGGNLEQSHYWRGRALQSLGRADEARQAYQLALKYNPHYARAAEALAALDR